MKIVERAGVQLQNVLTHANPWRGEDCERTNCLLCTTKMSTGKFQAQDCHKRNIVYETNCLTCESKQIEEIDKLEIDEKEKEHMKRTAKKFKYIGETSRSAY